jgi:hypothetical protein
MTQPTVVELLVDERYRPVAKRRPRTGMGAAAEDNDLTRAARRRTLCEALDGSTLMGEVPAQLG